MPLPQPKQDETEKKFIARCVPLVIKSEELNKDDEDDRNQAVAMCYSQWRKAKESKALGEGQGVGGARQGVGGAEWCICTECGHMVKHKRNVPCADRECPKCDGGMRGATKAEALAWEKERGGKSMKIKTIDSHLAVLETFIAEAGQETGEVSGNMAKQSLQLLKEAMAGKALELQRKIDQVRDAWREQYSKPSVPGTETPWYSVRVFEDPDLAVAELPEGLFAYPYTLEKDGCTFDKPYEVEFSIQRKESKLWCTDGVCYSQEPDEEAMIAFGGEVKALGDGRVGGYLVRFGNEDEKDLEGEWFTAKTYYGPANGDGADTLIHHGLPLPHDVADPGMKAELDALAARILSPMKTRRESLGIWAETVLDLADKYEALVHDIVEKGKLKWSSRSVTPLIRRKSDGEITRWPIVEGSLTPTPAEFRGTQVMPLKSYIEALAQPGLAEGGEVAGAACLEAAKAMAKSQLLLTEIEQES